MELAGLGLGGSRERAEGRRGAGDRVLLRLDAVVVDGRDLGGHERPAPRQALDAEALAALDDDVHPAVVELVQHLVHARSRAELTHPVLVREDEPELALLGDALADQLPVARLEDVERNALGRQEDDAEREEAELHGVTGYGPVRTMAAWLPTVSSPFSATPFPTRRSCRSRTERAAATISR